MKAEQNEFFEKLTIFKVMHHMSSKIYQIVQRTKKHLDLCTEFSLYVASIKAAEMVFIWEDRGDPRFEF